MKREILCSSCATAIRPVIGRSYPGEGVKFLPGVLKVHCFCDHCMAELKAGDNAEAVSIYTDKRPYFEWEGSYLK